MENQIVFVRRSELFGIEKVARNAYDEGGRVR